MGSMQTHPQQQQQQHFMNQQQQQMRNAAAASSVHSQVGPMHRMVNPASMQDNANALMQQQQQQQQRMNQMAVSHGELNTVKLG